MSTSTGSRIVVTGATGNVGTSVVRLLSEDPEVGSVRGLARRIPDWSPAKTQWSAVDLSSERTDLAEEFAGADAVVHLAWAFQPTHDPAVTWRTNVLGSIRVFEAVAAAKVPTLVHASSVGAYSPGPKEHAVDESWPTHGWPDAAYCREKAYLERTLDTFERDHPAVRVVRMRPAFLFKRESASEQRRIFGGRFLPGQLARPDLLPFLPDIPGLRVQALHTDDAARAYALAVRSDVRGAFNLAGEPPVDAELLGELLGARPVRLPRTAARSAIAAAWGLHLLPASPHLFDAVLRLPLMDCTRARTELGWHPEHTATEVLEEFLRGMQQGAGARTEPMQGRKVG
ncbi:nucleoside-diphosphate-sugar epimerase [Streptomyces sp. SAI-208]|uniref:SDR family oxidoreductase n=1 Tax=unclassified Streptomyces TaxID=2593676 RepID=UPI0024768C50|nr:MULTISPECIES: SDR family oxidoreductase [unclassified Streptomyces]MDH6514673.1 nucleoside-diphosphate-sugar epimerase [Streptomyces sp. SAI-090]MDH6546852.1 nucleoside-diphosphate-sugar epimerase [Streptomyces sp. SAI-041]MDH6565965.1 nucleoside-diphosphate-sugar epimerase [Streptomyces sp. SAI-117]MDH6589124.1 nucleoside-diphosphate-sugar epimerase [Streptomyces sp. SAI-133]MDH6605520.1 nucleoside-diphosphate-sugar epimerase [Streptomyces sp. SAI-208]